jgi:hypothetical protein
MSRRFNRWRRVLIIVAAMTCLAPLAASKNNKGEIPAVRWAEGNPGCTFSRSNDGKDHYGMWSDDVGIVMAVDSQELQKVHRRHELFFAVMLEVRYRGQAALDFSADNISLISLEFVKHFRVRQPVLDPDDFADHVQNDADTLNDQTAREVEKHPEEKERKEAYVRAYLRDSAELEEFVGKNSLRPTRLSPGSTLAMGWVLFNIKSKWIGKWKKHEEFILRVPVAGKMFEFPFQLPPKPGEGLLRRRE